MAKKVKFAGTDFNFGANVKKTHGRRLKGSKAKKGKTSRGKGGAYGS
jgi:hypothetical protein